MTARYCPCGAQLARDNVGALCSPCYRSSATTELTSGTWAEEVRLNAQAAASIYSRPFDFPNSRQYLAALSDPLDRLCAMFGFKPPVFDLPRASEGGASGRRARVGKYATAGHDKPPSETPRKGPHGIRIWEGPR